MRIPFAGIIRKCFFYYTENTEHFLFCSDGWDLLLLAFTASVLSDVKGYEFDR